jgi:TonB family protein
VEFVIDTAGHVEDGTLAVRQGQGPILDSLAVATARGFVFRPARMGGVPVRVLASLPINFGDGAPVVPTADSGVLSLECVDRAPELKSPGPIRYPEEMVAGRVRGEAVVEFIVDTGGRAEPSSIRVVQSTRATFGSVGREVVGRARFTPARLAGGAVRCRVRLPFVFEIARNPPTRVRGPEELMAVVITAWPS